MQLYSYSQQKKINFDLGQLEIIMLKNFIELKKIEVWVQTKIKC